MRAPKIPKRPENPGPDQGELLRFDVVPDGNTEPSQAGSIRVENIEVVPEGVFPDVQPEVSEGAVAANAISAEVTAQAEATAKRSSAQRGKHTPARHGDGSVRLGDVFYHNGKRVTVTERNYDETSVLYQRVWDAKQKVKPALGSEAIQGVVESVAASLSMDNAISTTEPEPEPKPTERELTVLPSRERMMALREDEIAGILPATHEEKNFAIYMVDALRKPGEVQNYFMLIHARTKQNYINAFGHFHGSHEAGDGAVISKLYEIGDYLSQSREEGEALIDLLAKLQDTPNWRLSLADDEFDGHKTALITLVRNLDLEQYRDYDQTPPFTLMTTREDRTSEQKFADKHKEVMDPYFAAYENGGDEEIKAYIEQRIANLRAMDVVKVLPRYIDAERKRYTFWENVLRGVRTPKFVATANAILEDLGRKPIGR